MIDIVSNAELRALAAGQGAHRVSMYLPTHRSGRETDQDRIRLKNLTSRAIEELASVGMRRTAAEQMVAPVTALLDDADFLAHLEDGLAVFVDDDGVRTYRVPDTFEELLVVADRFYLKPMLPLASSGAVFYVLALSQNQVRLLRGSRYRVSEVELTDIPRSLADALWYLQREKQLHLHGANRVGRGRVSAIFHGHGVGKEGHDTELAQFFRAVDDGIAKIIPDHAAPLVLAGVDYLHPIYRAVTRYPAVVEVGIEGNPELLSPEELHDRAWPLVEPIFAADRRAAQDAFVEATMPTVDTPRGAVEAARLGKVAALLLPRGVQRWAVVTDGGRVVEEHADRHPGDRDLLDEAAFATLAHGGKVFVVDQSEVPGEGIVAGVLRY